MQPVYSPRLVSRCSTLEVRGLACNLREWGPQDAPMLVMLHGHRDSSISWQFTVDALQRDWHVVAPDWRGFGHSGWAEQGYWHQDYMADLDTLLEKLSPQEPVKILAHSLGGNVANTYAGVRPERVAKLAAIDGFGLRHRGSDETPAHLAKWLGAWRAPVRGHKPYAELEEMAARLAKANERMDMPRARFLATHQHRQMADGTLVWSFDPAHARPFATLHRIDEWAACWRQITCPVLWIGSGRVFPPGLDGSDLDFDWRLQQIAHAQFQRIEGTSHNVHHDAPQQLAGLVERFMLAST